MTDLSATERAAFDRFCSTYSLEEPSPLDTWLAARSFHAKAYDEVLEDKARVEWAHGETCVEKREVEEQLTQSNQDRLEWQEAAEAEKLRLDEALELLRGLCEFNQTGVSGDSAKLLREVSALLSTSKDSGDG